ncbi:hypothetical protein [Algoriphagus marinus]|uniref:hypothetical protein n=1 Tax=Algoriphagus marinus TaxID=1925762 RepID=UPI00094BA382|nr:hypothetical protein [Algoriphagus marinus]
MTELNKNLKAIWQDLGTSIAPPTSAQNVLLEAKKLNQNSIKFQRGNLIVLGLSFLVMCYFLIFFFSFQDLLSKIGVALMLGFFLFRIVLEAYSIGQAKSDRITEPSSNNLEKEEKYLSLRVKIHSTYTYLTLGVYTLGFIFLLPEFAIHLSSFWMAAMVVSYFVPGIILTLIIRKNVQKELHELRTVVELKKSLMD